MRFTKLFSCFHSTHVGSLEESVGLARQDESYVWDTSKAIAFENGKGCGH